MQCKLSDFLADTFTCLKYIYFNEIFHLINPLSIVQNEVKITVKSIFQKI